MFINGGHVTSWGIDPVSKPSGSVVRAFYEPGDQWHHADENTVLKAHGIEARYFHFVQGPVNPSIAEDGGLIEILAFRASAKKRRAVVLDEFTSQETLGIV